MIERISNPGCEAPLFDSLPDCLRLSVRSAVRVCRAIFIATLGLVLPSKPAWSATTVLGALDGGGQRVTSSDYSMSGCLDGIGGISMAVSPSVTVRQGYIGQLYEVTTLVVTASHTTVSEGGNSQLIATATLDDGTILVVTGSNVNWEVARYPIAFIDADGMAICSSVYTDTTGIVSGYYLGTSNSLTLLVLDTSPDNFGIYANDGIPDCWQVQYFGTNNPEGVGNADADGSGQNNLFKYVAGLDPTNPASVFALKIASVPDQPSQKKLTYNPIAGGRTYTIESRTNLVSGGYEPLSSLSGPQTNVNEVTVTDQSAVQTLKFYRVRISLP